MQSRDAMPRDSHLGIAQNLPQETPMRQFVIEVSAAIALTLGAIIASATGASANDVMVMNAYARASATPVAKAGAAYVSLMNHGAEADRLLSVSTLAAASAELHTTVMEGDVMKMKTVGSLEIAPMATVEMQPGGLHVMLVGLSAPLKEGQKIELVFTFEKAGEVKVEVPVGAVAAGSHDHASGESSD
jgi:copper(I)-binding protein